MNKLDKFKKREMEYDLSDETRVLAEGELNGLSFVILNRGSHPCSYIKVHEILKEIDYNDIPLDCHGGLTFSGELKGYGGHWIGWDYAHLGDYIAYSKILHFSEPNAHAWTTDELLIEMEDVIYNLSKLLDFVNKVKKKR